MRRWPLVPTLAVAAAVLTMIALGVWQLRRGAWKEGLLAQYATAANMPAVDLDPLLDGRTALAPFAFRRALVSCRARETGPEIRAGRNGRGAVGQVYLIPCRPGADGVAGRIKINVGWSAGIRRELQPSLDGIVAGRLGAVTEEGPIVLVAATAAPPLAPSQPASIEAVPNNHLAYAFQWFFFALVAAAIYVLALRGRRRGELPPEP